jgi:two-component SAPR family response regulator
MIKVIAVDDEWYNLEELCGLIEETGFMSVIGKYQNPMKGLEEAKSICPQAAFIDIEMPEIDGITLAEKLLEINPAMIIVFITSWNQYAVQAFDLNALDYILKPIKAERFKRMVEKIRCEIKQDIPFQSQEIIIKCFDGLKVSIGSVSVKWERAKAEELFAYLLMNHNHYIHKETIIDNLWPEYEPAKALPILQTAICKIRNIFAQVKNEVKLDYSGNRYCLTLKNAKCDYFEVENALARYNAEAESTYLAIKEACALYHEGFLAQQGYLWSIEKDEGIRKKLTVALKEIILKSSGEVNNTEVVWALKLLAEVCPFEEDAIYY